MKYAKRLAVKCLLGSCGPLGILSWAVAIAGTALCFAYLDVWYATAGATASKVIGWMIYAVAIAKA